MFQLPDISLRTIGLFSAAGLVATAIGAGFLAWELRGIDWRSIDLAPSQGAIVVAAADGTEIGHDGPRRGEPVAAAAIPDVVEKAFLAIEDRRFASHFGVDPLGVARAAYSNWKAGRVVEGGSTITQQLARLRYLDREKTYRRKLREVAIAIHLERRFSKDEILAAYLNEVYFGSGVYGLAAAARSFFGKSVADLGAAEAAMLAGAVNAPSEISPKSDPRGAAARARLVVAAMEETGDLSPGDAAQARGELDALAQRETVWAAPEPGWFGDWAHQRARAASPAIASGGLPVTATATLDPQLQAQAEALVAEAIAEHGKALKVEQAALVAMRPDGAVLALVGGADYRASRFNRATQAKRQPGSLFKLVVYYAALRKGWRPDHTVMDEPLEIDGWKPANFDGSFAGETTLASAFAASRNIPAVQLAMDVGIEEVEAAARDLGISSPLAQTPSLALGTSEVTLLEITAAYASVRAGRTVTPYGIARLKAGDGPALTLAQPAASGDLPRHAGELTQMLRGAVENGTGRRARIDKRPVAGKTGTSQEHRDAWFVGFTEDLVVGVWVGNDDNSPTKGITGGGLPAEIWKRFVENAEVPAWGQPLPGLAPEPEAAEDDEELPEAEQVVASIAPERPATCDVAACASRYRSFRAADCTFQPHGGPRRICTATGGRPAMSVAAARRPPVVAGYCNVSACSARYRSFRASDCSYQPHGGPRRLCTAGSGPHEMPEHGSRDTMVTAYTGGEPVRRVYRVPVIRLFDRFLLPRGVGY